jgi:hypothetical protein
VSLKNRNRDTNVELQIYEDKCDAGTLGEIIEEGVPTVIFDSMAVEEVPSMYSDHVLEAMRKEPAICDQMVPTFIHIMFEAEVPSQYSSTNPYSRPSTFAETGPTIHEDMFPVYCVSAVRIL